MISTELIDKLPETPGLPILYVVYNDEMVKSAEFLIACQKGREYFDEHVTVVAFKDFDDTFERDPTALVYIDPVVMAYKGSWNN